MRAALERSGVETGGSQRHCHLVLQAGDDDLAVTGLLGAMDGQEIPAA